MDPCFAKRLWHMIRAAYYALRKGFSEHKLIMDLHLLLYRAKLAGKSIGNFLTSHHNHHTDPEECYPSHAFIFHNPDDVEFSCSNTPSDAESSRSGRRRRHQSVDVVALTRAALAMLSPDPHLASPQLRITDSPFSEAEEDGGSEDREAGEFIRWFREQLRLQWSPPMTPPPLPVDVVDLTRALAMLILDPHSASPQLRITDSPFSEAEEDGGSVDREAGEFIRWFREQLRLQWSPPMTPPPVDVVDLTRALAMLSPDPHSASPQLRITDSPFSEAEEDGGSVDREAESSLGGSANSSACSGARQ